IEAMTRYDGTPDRPDRLPSLHQYDQQHQQQPASDDRANDPIHAPPTFSPFSLKARRLARHREEILKCRVDPTAADSGLLLFGLRHCRSVSVLLKVGVHPRSLQEQQEYFDEEDRADDDGFGPTLFPIEATDVGRVAVDARREVVLVNPHAFENKADDAIGVAAVEANAGERKKILGKVTVETARLVAEVSQISSEDWARKYRYDEILWPATANAAHAHSTHTSSIDAVTALARAAVRDAWMHARNSTVCIVGGRRVGKTEFMFGADISEWVSTLERQGRWNPQTMHGAQTEEKEARDAEWMRYGLLGLILDTLCAFNENGKPCHLSIVEVADEDVLRDVLGFTRHELNEHDGHAFKLRHPDHRGAVLENLHRITVDGRTMANVTRAFQNERLKKIWIKEGGHGHFIATLSIDGGGMIQLVDCASADRSCDPLKSDTAWKQRNERRVNSIRKSLSSLRGVFRGLVLSQDASNASSSTGSTGGSPAISFRECTLTQLLQRCLQTNIPDGEKPRAVVIGAVCPSAKAYTQTLSTMDFTTRLLTRSGNTASDPFRNHYVDGEKKGYDRASFKNSALASVLPLDEEELGDDPALLSQEDSSFHSLPHRTPSMVSRPSTAASRSSSVGPSDGIILKSIVSDPRQRLAKLLSSASLVKNASNDTTLEKEPVETPISSSVASEDLNAEFRKRYDSVFDQLDTLMSMDEDDIDKRSFGNSLIETLSEKKPSRGGGGGTQHHFEHMSGVELFSPEVASWDNGVSRREHFVSAADKKEESHHQRPSGGESEQNGRSDMLSKSMPNIPSFVVCDDASCRDTVYTDKGMDYGDTNFNGGAIHDASCRDTVSTEKGMDYGDTNFNGGAIQQDDERDGDDVPPENHSTQLQVSRTMDYDHSSQRDNTSTFDGASINSDNQMVKALQSQLEQVMMEDHSSRCSVSSSGDHENDAPSDKQDIFVKSSSRLLPLNVLLSQDSMDSEPLLSCRSHATMIYGSLHVSQNGPGCFQDLPTEDNLNEDCDENCAYFRGRDDVKSVQSDPLELNDMMATFEKEIDAIMGLEDIADPPNERSANVGESSTRKTAWSGDRQDSTAFEHENNDSELQEQRNQTDLLRRRVQTSTNIDATNVENGKSHSSAQTDMLGDEVASLKERVEERDVMKSQTSQSATQTDSLGDDLDALKEKVKSLTAKKSASESFIQRLESIVYEDSALPLDAESVTSSRLLDLEDAIQQNRSLASNLQTELLKSSAKIDTTILALRNAETELEAACNAKSAAELKLQDLVEIRRKLGLEMDALNTFIAEIEGLFEINFDTDTATETRRRVCIDRIKDLKSKLQNATEDNQTLQSEIDCLHATITQKESEFFGVKTLAETEQARNAALSQEVSVLQDKLLKVQRDLHQLTTEHTALCSDKDKISEELHHARQCISSRDADISQLKGLVNASEQKLKTFGAKTAEVMKARLAGLKADHAAKIESLNKVISTQHSRIGVLEEEIRFNVKDPEITRELSVVKSELSRSNTDKTNLEKRIEQMEKSTSLKLRNVSQQLKQAQSDVAAANEDASKHQAENKSLKVELSHLRDVMGIAEESVGELQRLRQENESLQRALNNQSGHGMLSTSFEIHGKRSADSVGFDDDRFVHERISALMRENEHNNISMRTLQKENAALKGSMDQCQNLMLAMQREIRDLKTSTAGRRTSPSEESTMTHVASSMKTPPEQRSRHKSDFYFPFASSTSQTEETSVSERQLVAELSAEKELRYNAEEICAGVLATTQAGYEKRDKEIKKLRAKLFS
ncbi:hypothetical protein HJC23_011713, partial [Cyclotella cryptica]